MQFVECSMQYVEFRMNMNVLLNEFVQVANLHSNIMYVATQKILYKIIVLLIFSLKYSNTQINFTIISYIYNTKCYGEEPKMLKINP